MHPAPIHPLLTTEGALALELASGRPDPGSLATATALRKQFEPELAALASTQAELRIRARAKFGQDAHGLLFTPTGLEQATRLPVARWRAQELLRRGVTRMVDLGCGLGIDALAAGQAGIEVVGVELDEITAAAAAHNLATVGGSVLVGDVEQAGDLHRGRGDSTVVFVDPARRTARGRSWNPEDLSPPWNFVQTLMNGPEQFAAKLGPGIDRGLLPPTLDRAWVSVNGDVVEASLFTPIAHRAPHSGAVRLGDRPDQLWAPTDALAPDPGVGPLRTHLYEPDGALSRARLVGTLAEREGWTLNRLHPQIAYLGSDEVIDSPWLRGYAVIDVLDHSTKALRAWVRANDIGVLEIKKRGVDIDPAQLRRDLRPRGGRMATLVLSPTPTGLTALWVRPLVAGSGN